VASRDSERRERVNQLLRKPCAVVIALHAVTLQLKGVKHSEFCGVEKQVPPSVKQHR